MYPINPLGSAKIITSSQPIHQGIHLNDRIIMTDPPSTDRELIPPTTDKVGKLKPNLPYDVIAFFDSSIEFAAAQTIDHQRIYPHLRAIEFAEVETTKLDKLHVKILPLHQFKTNFILYDSPNLSPQSISFSQSPANINQISILNPSLLDILGLDGTGVKVGIIDNGIDVTHPLLDHLTIFEEDFSGDGRSGNKDHGSRVLSVLSGMDDNGTKFTDGI